MSLLSNILCTEIKPATCSNCGNKVIREHKTAGYLANGIFAAMGIPYLVLIVILFEYLPWVLAGTVLIILAGYLWDTLRVNPVVYSEDMTKQYNKRTTKVLVIMALILLAVLVIGANGT